MRFVLTGAPGSGKTTLLTALAERGYGVVPESATDLISRLQREGIDEPWRDRLFTTWICDLQRERRERADVQCRRPVTVYDRSPVCTLALARFLGHPVGPTLAAEISRILEEGVYERDVLFLQPLGWIEPTAVRRISYDDSLEFAEVHRAVYLGLGFRLIDVPVLPVAERADLVRAFLLRQQTRVRPR